MVVDHLREKNNDKGHAEKDMNDNNFVKFIRRVLPMTDDLSEEKFFVKIDGRSLATPLFLALIVIEMTDLVFAVDSIPAVLAVSTNLFIVYTSNIFAILGLRSLYFALRGVMDYFYYLKYGLSVILIFIGSKMMINHYSNGHAGNFHIPTNASLFIILALLVISIVLSIVRSRIINKRVVVEPVVELDTNPISVIISKSEQIDGEGK